MPEHKQVPFLLRSGKSTKVDMGLYHILWCLRELNVVTQYSCQANLGNAYVLGTTHSFLPIVHRILDSVVQNRGPDLDLIVELENNPVLGERLTLRWPSKQTRDVLEVLKRFTDKDQYSVTA